MNIGIVSHINPNEFKEFIKTNDSILNLEGASSVNALCKGMLESGHNLWIFSSYDGKSIVKYEGINLHIILVPRKGLIPYSFLVKLIVSRRLIEVIDQHIKDLDVLHAQWTYEYALAAKSFVNEVPVFCTLRDWCPRIRDLQTKWKSKLVWKFNTLIFRNVMKCKKIHFIANSEYIRDKILDIHPSYEVDIIYNSINFDFVLKTERMSPTTIRFVSITQNIITAGKNYGNLLIAFSKYLKKNKNAELLIIGAYDRDYSLFKEWESAGLFTNVNLMGVVPHQELPTILDTCTALIHPSLEESFGNTLLEGMARKIPVVGGEKSGAVPYILGFGKYGFLCNVEDVDSILDTMFALENEENVRNKVDAAYNYLINNYSNSMLSQKQILLYEKYIT